jgi:hypothetical protein
MNNFHNFLLKPALERHLEMHKTTLHATTKTVGKIHQPFGDIATGTSTWISPSGFTNALSRVVIRYRGSNTLED